MAPPGDVYERELKSLLTGDQKAIAKMVRSLGVDLVALRWDFSFPIEVKSSGDSVLHFSKNQHLTEQADIMLADCCRSHLVPIYAFRLKSQRGDPWRLFTIPTDHAYRGRHSVLYRRLPKLEVSDSGYYIMRWENGMKLSDFMGYTGMSDYSQQRWDPVRTHRAHHGSASVPHHPEDPARPIVVGVLNDSVVSCRNRVRMLGNPF